MVAFPPIRLHREAWFISFWMQTEWNSVPTLRVEAMKGMAFLENNREEVLSLDEMIA
jgi:hypothetical protein